MGDPVVCKLDTNGNIVWIRQTAAMSTDAEEADTCIAIDTSENVYVSYTTNGTISGGIRSSAIDIAVLKFNSSGASIWAKQYTNMNTFANEISPNICADSSGNVYITYSTGGTVSGGIQSGNSDVVVTKLDTNGALVWIKQQAFFNSAASESLPSITADSSGNVFVLYTTAGTISGGMLSGSQDMVIMRMDTNGNVVWIKQDAAFNTNQNDTSFAPYNNSIALDSAGNVYAIYSTYGAVAGSTVLGGAIPWDVVVLKLTAASSAVIPTGISFSYGKYDSRNVIVSWLSKNEADTIKVYRDTQSSGATKTLLGTSTGLSYTDASALVRGTTYYYFVSGVLSGAEGTLSSAYALDYTTTVTLSWLKQLALMNTAGADSVASIAHDSSGNVYVAYQVSGTLSGGTLGVYTPDIAVAKLDSNGNVVWIKQHRAMNVDSEQVPYIAVDSSSNVYISYRTSAAVSGGSHRGTADVALAKLDTNGNIVWLRQNYNTNVIDTPSSLSLYGNSIYMGITTEGSVSGGSKAGLTDIVLHKIDLDGNLIWSRQQGYNTSGHDTGVKVFAASNGSVYMTYITTGTISGGTANSTADVVVTKIDADGNRFWIKQYPAMNSTGWQQTPHIVVDSSGNAYIVYLAGATVSGGTYLGNYDVVFAKLDTNGALVWIKQQTVFNTRFIETSPSLAIDADANIYATFLSAGTISGGTLGSAGSEMVFMKMDSNGNVIWTRQELVSNVSNAAETLPMITVDASYNIYISYHTTGTVSGGALMGSSDIVVMKYGQQMAVANAGQAIAQGVIASYVNAQTVATDAEKAVLSVDMRAAIKTATYANNAAKAADQVAYIDAMRAKVGASSYIVPQANFETFKATYVSSASGLTPKPTMVYVPAYTATLATIDISNFNNSHYFHAEVPVTYSLKIVNGVDEITITFDGTKFVDAATQNYVVNDQIILGSKTLTLVGIGSGNFGVTNTGEATCMMEGTLITTPAGNQAIETLRTGDMVVTGARTVAPITKINKIVVVRAIDINVPYVIQKGAFGENSPPQDMHVSPRHAIQLRPGLWEIPREAAKENAKVYKDASALDKRVIYYHFSLPNYETDTIIANGQVTECLNDGSVKESYTWSAAEKGYKRVIKRLDDKAANTTLSHH
jgi:hypothetical protein